MVVRFRMKRPSQSRFPLRAAGPASKGSPNQNLKLVCHKRDSLGLLEHRYLLFFPSSKGKGEVSQERKISPKRKFWGWTSRRSKSWKNKHFSADIHDPKARTSTTLRGFQKLRSEKLWAEFSFPSKLTGLKKWRGILGTIVKPLWQLPPSEAKNPPTFPEQRM